MNLYLYLHKIDIIIDEALELKKEEQEPFIIKRCSHNPDMLKEALDYYSFIKKAEEQDFLEPGDDVYPHLIEQAGTHEMVGEFLEGIIGKQIGPYCIRKPIGEGGMGMVYLAERVKGDFDQKVAIKFLRGGFFSVFMRKRFAIEKRILSKLDHPNISRLLDGGITDDGTPYLTMEYIDGVPLDLYCVDNKSGIEERLDIFLQICKAVQFAHSKLIIHRDLKPHNILITPEGQVKVMDFGIAKILDPDVEKDSVLQTREGHFIASLEYASPEQFRTEDPTLAIDIYQLGLILHKLLTDRLPYSVKGCSPAEAEHIICNTSPTRPSISVANVKSGDKANYESPLQRKHLKGDLDTIILKALQKDPEQRYSSAEMLAGDIERHIAGLPILARPATIGYRTGKFIKRHRNILSAACLLIAGIIGMNVHYTSQLSDERDAAQNQAKRAEAVKNFMVDMFSEADPYAAPGEPISVRALLAHSVDDISTQFANQPDIALELLNIIGSAQVSLANRQQAITTFEKGLELIHSSTEDSDPVILASFKYTLAHLYQASDHAFNLLSRALELIDDYPEERTLHAGIFNTLAYYEFVQGDYEHSARLIRRATDIACETETLEENPDFCSSALNDSYYFLSANGEHEEALAASERGYQLVFEYYRDTDHLKHISAGITYANALIDHHQPNKAIEVIEQSLDIAKNYISSDNMIRMAHLRFPFSFAESARGNDNLAIEHWRWSLSVLMEQDPEGLGRPVQLNFLAGRLLNLWRVEEARNAYVEFAFEEPDRIPFHAQWIRRYNELRIEVMTNDPMRIPHERWLEIIEEFNLNYDHLIPELKIDALEHAIDRQDLSSAQYWHEQITSMEDIDIDDVRTARLTLARYWLAINEVENAKNAIEQARMLFHEREEIVGPRIAKLNALQAEIHCRSGNNTAGLELLQQAEQEWLEVEGHPDGLLTIRMHAATCFNQGL